ncbi:Hermansky-Pudlak syndrome 5 protein homolog [Eumeta japonica]|uniref:Hermansky-Pudlak syndrome 5 protein homolog n=1 Tax=Eumeta variegata TaxID=151549 RepID=A0A4C1ZKM3_EUMVA|nr:Hermansky-Pudlak syndrome 5 protein homolog [Eumeta japonica]
MLLAECNVHITLWRSVAPVALSLTKRITVCQLIEYSCFDVSKTLIAFSATSGGIYIFNRQPCEFTQLIPNKDGAITRLAISPNEKHIAIANGHGVVSVCSCDQNSGHSSILSKEHHGNEVTAMVWGTNNIFIGDDVGKVSVLQLPNFITKTIFPTAAQAIMNLDSRICQLDIKDCMLLVSTLTRCYICDTQKEQYRQIGQKLRDGEFGACLVTTSKSLENGTLDNVKKDITELKKYEVVSNEESFSVNEKLADVLIYCARPSSRLWEASINGTVVRTHQFKHVLAKTPVKVISALSYENENVSVDYTTTLMEENDNKYSKVSPEAIQTIKEIGSTVSDKLSISKKILKEKWESVEEKVKHLHLSSDKALIEENVRDFTVHEKNVTVELPSFEKDIIFKDSSQISDHISEGNDKSNTVLKSLYQCYRLSLVDKETDVSNLTTIIDDYSCDINEIYKLMLDLEEYCISLGLGEEANAIVSNVFLNYASSSKNKDDILSVIIANEALYKYFVNCCICVNLKTQKLMNLACDCGFPLPYIRTYQSPEFSDLIDAFVEKQWPIESKSSCYEICRQMPFLWRKILYLRRNEDLMKILRILLQMLDESLLHNFLPQFTLDTWYAAIKLYATLHANICLNCGKKFENVIVKDTLSWDGLGALMIKSIGGRNAIKIMEKHAELIGMGEITMKFYHTCLLVCLYEEFDNSITCKMTDTLYSAYVYEEARNEILNLLRTTINGSIKNTSLPLIVAAQSTNWGMSLICTQNSECSAEDNLFEIPRKTQKWISLQEIFEKLTNTQRDCSLCGLPLVNEVLIRDSGLWVFVCGHVFHGACLNVHKVKLCPSCTVK